MVKGCHPCRGSWQSIEVAGQVEACGLQLCLWWLWGAGVSPVAVGCRCVPGGCGLQVWLWVAGVSPVLGARLAACSDSWRQWRAQKYAQAR